MDVKIMTPLERNRWNSDDKAIAELQQAHWNRFFDEPKYAGRDGKQSRKHKAYAKALRTITRAIIHLRSHTPEYHQEALELLAIQFTTGLS